MAHIVTSNGLEFDTIDPEPEPTAEERRRTHRRAARALRAHGIAAEIDEALRVRFARGMVRPAYGERGIINHFALNFYDRVSLCRRLLTSTSGEMIATPLGIVCPWCRRIWNRAMDRHNAEVNRRIAAAGATTADEQQQVLRDYRDEVEGDR